MRWNLKEAGCEEHTNSRANLWSDEQKSHMRNMKGKVGTVAFKAIKTYPLISKITMTQEFADGVSEAIKELKEDGTAAKLSEQFYGKNIFEEYTFEQGW